MSLFQLCIGALVLYLVLYWPVEVARSIHRGLRMRSRLPFTVLVGRSSLEIVDGRRYQRIEARAIARARYARISDWGTSWLIENALTLYAANGQRLAKIPEAAHGFGDVVGLLAARNLPVDVVEIERGDSYD